MSKTRFQCALRLERERTCVVVMTSCSLQPAKFRWTEKLTCRFIQLRRDHAKMFTGRKYSAQQGWEYILREMKDEFPAIMADVHYRVLKKKWSNLLQQYKELKNPVHGDKNRADDISWPFYAAIDEVIASLSRSTAANDSRLLRRRRRRRGASCINDEQRQYDNNNEEDLNPQEFLCVSVRSPDDETTMDYETFPVSSMQQPLDASARLLSRLPLTVRPAAARREISRDDDDDEVNETTTRPSRKSCRKKNEEEEEGLERRIVEFMEYARQRDAENRSILTRMLEALEDIRNALR